MLNIFAFNLFYLTIVVDFLLSKTHNTSSDVLNGSRISSNINKQGQIDHFKQDMSLPESL